MGISGPSLTPPNSGPNSTDGAGHIPPPPTKPPPVRDTSGSGGGLRSGNRNAILSGNAPLLEKLSDLLTSRRLSNDSMGAVTGGNPFLAPSALTSLTIAIYGLMSVRSEIALKESEMSADFTLMAQKQAENISKTIIELGDIEARDLILKAVISGVSAAMSIGMAFGGGAIGKKLAPNAGEMAQGAASSALNQGLQGLGSIASNVVGADTAVKKAAAEAIKNMQDFSMQTTQKAGQDAAQAAQHQKDDFAQLQQLLDKFVDALTKWHGQRG